LLLPPPISNTRLHPFWGSSLNAGTEPIYVQWSTSFELALLVEHKAPHPSLVRSLVARSIGPYRNIPLSRAERQLSPRTGRSTSRKRGCLGPIGRLRLRISWVSKEATLRLARRNPGLGDLHSSSRCDVYQQVATVGRTPLSLE
jgi:hypothetical protein